MRELIAERGTSYRALAARTYESKSRLHRIATGTAHPPDVATPRRSSCRIWQLAVVEAGRRIDSEPIMSDMTMCSAVPSRRADVADARPRSEQAHRQVLQDSSNATRGSTVDDWRRLWEYGFSYITADRDELLRTQRLTWPR
jgi:hypothetical protein